MWLQIKLFTNPVELQINFYRIVGASADRDFFPAQHGDGSKICRRGGINDDTVRAPIRQWLASKIKHRRMQIEQVRKTEFARLRAGRATLAFCPCAIDPIICEGEMSNDFL